MAPTEKLCAKCGFLLGLENFNKFARNRDGLQSYCRECMREAAKKSYWKDPEKSRAASRDKARAAREKNPSENRLKCAEYRAKNIDSARERDKSRYHSNPTRMEAQKLAAKAAARRFPEKRAAIVAERRAAALKATPKWRNPFFIREAYHLARLRSSVTGITWQVDHVVPLKSAMVCGLHAETNLQVIPQKVNASKQNAYWPDMP